MTPKAKSNVLIAGDPSAGGKEAEEQNTEPEVSPRDLADALQVLKGRFGNVDENYDTGFVAKVETISEEAEGVALDIAGGREITAQEQQDMMWNQGSVSVWDLEQIEKQAREQGAVAVWEEEGIAQVNKDNEARMKGLQQDSS